MKKISSVQELRDAIKLLEIKQAEEGVKLKEQFKTTYESLKPINLIKNALSEFTTAPDFKGEFLNTTASIAAGYLSKKAAVGSSHSPIKQLLGTLLQVGVTSIVSKNADGIKSVAKFLVSKIFNKKDEKEESAPVEN